MLRRSLRRSSTATSRFIRSDGLKSSSRQQSAFPNRFDLILVASTRLPDWRLRRRILQGWFRSTANQPSNRTKKFAWALRRSLTAASPEPTNQVQRSICEQPSAIFQHSLTGRVTVIFKPDTGAGRSSRSSIISSPLNQFQNPLIQDLFKGPAIWHSAEQENIMRALLSSDQPSSCCRLYTHDEKSQSAVRAGAQRIQRYIGETRNA